MRPAVDLDVPTVIRQALGLPAPPYYWREVVGLVERCRYRVLFIDFVRRVMSSELTWR